MADSGIHGLAVDMKDTISTSKMKEETDPCFSLSFFQKLVAEVFGTYFLIFAGCGVVVVNKNNQDIVTLPGIAIVWGLAVMVLVYTVGHISGAHFNPAVTIAFAVTRRFPLKQMLKKGKFSLRKEILSLAGSYAAVVALIYHVKVPAYVSAQILGSTLAAGTLRLVFTGIHDQFAGTQPAGSDGQAFVLEFITTFYLMFVICGVATDNRAIGELAGLAVGATIMLNVMFIWPITGASLNPARSLGPAIVSNNYKGIWIYLLAPTVGAISGAAVYNTIRFTDKPLREVVRSGSFLRNSGRSGSN